MKRLLIGLLLPLAAIAQKPEEFKLKGELQLAKPIDWVYLSYFSDGNRVNDSFQMKANKFTYKSKLTEPVLATLRVKYAQGADAKAKVEQVPLFLQKGKIKVTAKDSLKGYTVSGSEAHKDYLALSEKQKVYSNMLNALYAEWSVYHKEKNAEGKKRVEAEVDSLDKLLKENVYRAFVEKNPKSPVAFYAVRQYAGYDIDADKVAPLFAALPAQTQQWPSAVDFKEQLEIAKKTGIGKMAMDFTQNDTLGNPVSLSSFKGKYVLVDFWASWCGPCRVENPNVVAVFNQYKDKGFTVLGVSLDRPNAKEKWLKAIHDDNLTWTHVSDLKFWDNEVAKQYGIKAIPQNLLIDPAGKIIAKNIRGEELGQAVEKAVNGAAF